MGEGLGLGLHGMGTGRVDGKVTEDNKSCLGKGLQPTWALLLRDRALYISSMLVATDSKQALKRSKRSFLICSNACLAFLALFRAASNSATRERQGTPQCPGSAKAEEQALSDKYDLQMTIHRAGISQRERDECLGKSPRKTVPQPAVSSGLANTVPRKKHRLGAI